MIAIFDSCSIKISISALNTIGRKICTQSPQRVVLVRYFQPAHSSFFAMGAKQTHSPVRNPVVRPEIHHLVLRTDGKITALDVHADTVQHVGSSDKRQRLFDARAFLAANDGVSHYVYFRQRTRPNDDKPHSVVVVQIGGAEGAAHALFVYFTEKLEAVIGEVDGGPENGQGTRLHKAGRIVGPASGQVRAAFPAIQAGAEVIGVGNRGAAHYVLVQRHP